MFAIRKEETGQITALLSPKTRCYRGCNKKGKKRMKGPEDDEGLAGKVALISGGGAAGASSCWRRSR